MRATDVIEAFAELIGAGDIGRALALYEHDAAFVVEPGRTLNGHQQIQAALEGFASLQPVLKGDIEQVVYAADLALVTNRWTLDGTTTEGEPVHLAGRSSDVLRRASDGRWKIAIDDPWGGGT